MTLSDKCTECARDIAYISLFSFAIHHLCISLERGGGGNTSNLSGFVTQVSSLFFRFPFSRAHPRGQIPWGWERPVEVQFDGDEGSYVRNVSYDEGDNDGADSPLSWHGGPPYAPRCY